MSFKSGSTVGRNGLVIIATACFVLVALAAIFSIVGLVDAYLAANLYVFDALGDFHASVFGAVTAIIATLGVGAALVAVSEGRRRAANATVPTPFSSSVNHKLDAARIQAMLHVLQYPVRIDGAFGPETTRAIREFQEDHDLLTDGVVGPLTLETLQIEVESQGRSDWVSEILYRRSRPQQSTAPVLSLIGTRRPA